MIIHNYFNIISVLVLFLIVLYLINKENNYFSFGCNNENFAILVCDDNFKKLVEKFMDENQIDSSKTTDDISNYNIESIRNDLFAKTVSNYENESILLSKIVTEAIIKQLEVVKNAQETRDKETENAKKIPLQKKLDTEKKKITDEISKEELTEKFITLQHIKDIIKEKIKEDGDKTKIVVNRTSDIFDTNGLENVIDIGKIRGSVDSGIRKII